MAIGPYTLTKYSCNNGDIRAISVQPETLTLTLNSVANAAPTGTVDTKGRAKVSGSRRSYGAHARKVTIRLTAAGPSGEVGSIISLPWLSFGTFEALPESATGTYNTSACILVGTTPEKIK
jgi:hypothetical protein